jgi:hypothetical protein
MKRLALLLALAVGTASTSQALAAGPNKGVAKLNIIVARDACTGVSCRVIQPTGPR